MGRTLGVLAAGVVLSLSLTAARAAGEGEHKPAAESPEIERQKWTFGGLFGHFDEQQLRRGFKVYKDVCSGCHNLRLLSYRNLGEPGGPHLPEAEVKAIAGEVEIQEGIDAEGKPIMRKAKPSDSFQWKLGDEKKAVAQLGAVPPDLSLITRARSYEREFAWYAFPWVMLKDLATQYQEQGADYVYAFLNGFTEAPVGMKVTEGLNYNRAFPGHQTAMPKMLDDGSVTYEDGTSNKLDQEAKDITAFLAWAAEPHLAERKKMGLMVVVYLAVLAGLLLLAKKTLWRNVEH
jgi:cytochrome c1